MAQVDAQPVGRLDGRIEFRDPAFGYTPPRTVLRRFNLMIKAGEMLAIVGHTGAGADG